MREQRGFSLIELLIVVAIIGIIAAIAVPRLVLARRTANEASAVGTLRSLASAESAYMGTVGLAGTLPDLIAARAIDPTLTDASVHNNYVLNQVAISGSTFEFSNTPQFGSAVHGSRSYNLVEDMVIRYKSGSTAPSGTTGSAIGVK